MGIDLEMDPLDDLFSAGATINARATGKFQPKSKLQKPRKESASSFSSSHAVQINVVKSQLSDSTTKEKPLDQNDMWNYEQEILSNEKIVAKNISKVTGTLHPGQVVIPNDNVGWHSSMEKSPGENVDIFIGLESLDDFPPATTDIEVTAPSETIAVTVPNSGSGGNLGIQVFSSADESNHTSKFLNDPSCSLTTEEPNISGSHGVGHMDNIELETEVMDVMDIENASYLLTTSEKRNGKFQPKPKMQLVKETNQTGVESFSSPLGTPQVTPEIYFSSKDSIPSSENLDAADFLAEGFGYTIPADRSSDLPVTDEFVNFTGVNQLISDIHEEGDTEMPTKLVTCRAKTGSRKTPAVSDTPQLHEKAFIGQGRTLRPRKSKNNQFVDEPEDEALAGKNFSDECHNNNVIEDNNSNEEYQVEVETETKKVKRKSKNPDGAKERKAGKSKKTKLASEQDADPKPKRFSHSTRRRKVDKNLLQIPDDEFNYQEVPLRDLIQRAEHKDRLMRKEEAVIGAPSRKPRNNDSSEFLPEDETSSPRVEERSMYLNYQTYMERTPVMRWSKQDTELFYEAVRQFGTDLSLIQQLFPDRTRRQVKLKYKKEERQHPMRLREALTNRAKDHSHFERVIERLNQIAAEENENADKDGSTELPNNDVADDEIPEINDEERKKEPMVEEENKGDAGQNPAEVGSPVKSYDSEDELFRWSQYKADT